MKKLTLALTSAALLATSIASFAQTAHVGKGLNATNSATSKSISFLNKTGGFFSVNVGNLVVIFPADSSTYYSWNFPAGTYVASYSQKINNTTRSDKAFAFTVMPGTLKVVNEVSLAKHIDSATNTVSN